MRQRKKKKKKELRNLQIQQSNCRLLCNIISSSSQRRGEGGRHVTEMTEWKEAGFWSLLFLCYSVTVRSHVRVFKWEAMLTALRLPYHCQVLYKPQRANWISTRQWGNNKYIRNAVWSVSSDNYGTGVLLALPLGFFALCSELVLLYAIQLSFTPLVIRISLSFLQTKLSSLL